MDIVPKVFLLLLAVIIMFTAVMMYAGAEEDEGKEIDRISIDEGSVHTTEHTYKPVYSAMVYVVIALIIVELTVGIVWIVEKFIRLAEGPK